MSSVPSNVPCYGFKEAKSKGEVMSYPVKPLAKTDADIKITYCGVCATDLHMVNNDWGMTRYPLVPGHEIVGHVIAIGSDVTNVKIGDAVCLGCMAQSCYTCDYCKAGDDNLCAKRTFTYMGDTTDETGSHPHYGGFGGYMRTDARKLFAVPDGLEEKYVGPLMCAGVTIFNPIHRFLDGVDGTGKTIGVVGIGGLGHLGLQMLSKMGATAVALSRGTGKEQFAKELGAKYLIDTTNDEAMAAAAGTFDQIIVTANGPFDSDKYIPLLKFKGNLHFCGLPAGPVSFNMAPVIFSALSISGNPVGGEADTKTMLEFCAKHGIKPIIEEFPHSKAYEALEKVEDGSIRFRAVLKNDLA